MKTKNTDLMAPDTWLEEPLLNGSLTPVFTAPFAKAEEYADRLREARAEAKEAAAAVEAARAAYADAEDASDEARVLADLKESKPAAAEKARKAAEAARSNVEAAERDLRLKEKTVTVLEQLKAQAEHDARQDAKDDADKIRSEKVAAMADAMRAVVRANAELAEVELNMQHRGLLATGKMLLHDPNLMPKHLTGYYRPRRPNGERASAGVIKATRASRWFDTARLFGFDV